jgi:Ca-activated chloride channel family protein
VLFKIDRLLPAALLIAAFISHAPTRGQTPAPTPAAPAGAGPLVYGLVVDNSGSMRAGMGHVIDAAKVFVQANREGEEAFVVRFVSSDRIQVIQDLTRDRGRLARALDEMYVEGGQTAVNDAVHLAADYLSKNAPDDNRPRALVLLTDGEDRASFYKTEQLLQFLRDRKIRVYVLGFPEQVKNGPGGKRGYERAVALIKSLSEGSGGRAVSVERMDKLEAGAAELLKHLRNN